MNSEDDTPAVEKAFESANLTEGKKRRLSFRELQKALEDDSHPRHAEAIQRSRELAAELSPAMESLRQTVERQQAGTKQFLAERAKVRDAQENIASVTKDITEGSIRRQRDEAERAQKEFEVLKSMDAKLGIIEDGITSLDGEIKKGNKDSGRVAKWTLGIAIITLVVTAVGLVVASVTGA